MLVAVVVAQKLEEDLVITGDEVIIDHGSRHVDFVEKVARSIRRTHTPSITVYVENFTGREQLHLGALAGGLLDATLGEDADALQGLLHRVSEAELAARNYALERVRCTTSQLLEGVFDVAHDHVGVVKLKQIEREVGQGCPAQARDEVGVCDNRRHKLLALFGEILGQEGGAAKTDHASLVPERAKLDARNRCGRSSKTVADASEVYLFAGHLFEACNEVRMLLYEPLAGLDHAGVREALRIRNALHGSIRERISKGLGAANNDENVQVPLPQALALPDRQKVARLPRHTLQGAVHQLPVVSRLLETLLDLIQRVKVGDVRQEQRIVKLLHLLDLRSVHEAVLASFPGWVLLCVLGFKKVEHCGGVEVSCVDLAERLAQSLLRSPKLALQQREHFLERPVLLERAAVHGLPGLVHQGADRLV
mmetsp:Transcript_9087/g.25885  ORF Transcript_9087/g.25885 Transcript_9087/m.25885 type:complete len:423 (+) Transcript_9087:163-1431(+)